MDRVELLSRRLESFIDDLRRHLQEEVNEDMLDNISVQCDQLSRHFSRLAGISGWERIDEAMALVQRVSVIVRSLLEQGRTQAATGYRSQPIQSGRRGRPAYHITAGQLQYFLIMYFRLLQCPVCYVFRYELYDVE